MEKERGLEDAENKFIESLIYHKMRHLDVFWSSVEEVTAGLRRIKKEQRSKHLRITSESNGRALVGKSVKPNRRFVRRH